ncbi:MAG: hypothetical protein KJ686_05290 [Actinobacteria bacterium]|nr:hypothetical protein [Actinomycetota bacterium]
MVNHVALSALYRVITTSPLNRLLLPAMDFAFNRYGHLLPREALGGLDSFFFRDAMGNIDSDGDGVPDSFRVTVTNAWFDQRITGIKLYIDGRRVPAGRILFRYPGGETRGSRLRALEFPPGDAMEILVEGLTLPDGLHFLDMTLEMEIVSQLMPALPVLMKDGAGDFAVLPDRFDPLPEWPPPALPPGVAHVVPHIHYDVEWLRTREVFEGLGRDNLREAMRLMEQDPDMTFVVDQVPQLEPFERDDPEGFRRLSALVGQGRVEPVNGMYSEPDTNIISGESLVRQSVAWQRYALEKFGRTSRCGWLIDSFGMSAQLPQILKGSGSDFLAYSRAAVPEGTPSEFLWEGLDGTRLLTHNLPGMYNIGHPVPTDRGRAMRRMLKNYRLLRSRSASGHVFYPGGVDHGRPQKEYGEMARAFSDAVDGVTFEFSLPTRFFEAVPAEGLRVVTGEFQRELWGTYSARADIKMLNRASEFSLSDAGKMAAVASLFGAPYPAGEIERGWRAVMDNQFHDQICGCCTDEVASGMVERFKEARKVSRALMGESARFLIGGSRAGEGFKLLVFNPLSRPVSSWVEFELDPPPGWECVGVSAGGERLPVQVVDAARYGDGTLKRVKAGFRPDLPPLGYRVFDVEPVGGGQPEAHGAVTVDGTAISNGLITVEVDPRSGLLRRAELADGMSFNLSGGNRLTLERDFGNLYQVFALGTTFLRRRTVEQVRVVEEGPLRGTVEVRGKVGRSPFVQRISLVAGSPRIDMETSIDFRDRGCRLRCRFPTGLAGGRWTHEVPYGWMERPGHELPAQNFTDLSRGDAGITLVNYGVPGNKCHRGTIYMTMLRSVDKIFLWDSGPGALQLGERKYRYALYPHQGGFSGIDSSEQAYLHNNPPRAFVLPAGAGSDDAPSSFGAVHCSPGALVSVMEPSGDEVLLRLWETGGEPRTVELELGWNVGRAHKADLLERKGEELDVNENKVSLPLRPFEIATVLLEGP